jgi:hypothetical protein
MEKRKEAFFRREMRNPNIRALPKKKRFRVIDIKWKRSKQESLKAGKPKESTSEIVKESKIPANLKKVVDNMQNSSKFPLRQIESNIIDKGELLDAKERTDPNLKNNDGPGFKGENHAIGIDKGTYGSKYSFAGPGTKIKERLARGDQGIKLPDGSISTIDAAAKVHDIEYQRIADKFKKSKGDFNPQDVRKSDNKFVQRVNRANKEPNLKKVILTAFKAKKFAEDAGILSPKKFALSGT